MSKLPSGTEQHFWRDVGHSAHVTESQILTDIMGNLFNVSLNRQKNKVSSDFNRTQGHRAAL